MNICIRALLGIALALAACSTVAAARARALSRDEVRAGPTAGQLVVPAGKSQLLHLDQPFREISVGSKDIADVQPLSRTTIYVLGKKMGTTNLTIRGAGGAVIAVVDVDVTYDVEGLATRIHEMMPDENIKIVPAGDAIELEGVVQSADHLREIAEIADHYAPGKVANMLSIVGSQQILLQVRFAEVQRTALSQLGINTNLAYHAGGDTVQALTGAAASTTPFGQFTGIFNHGNYQIAAQLNALEQKGLVRTLAEPNLIALSGDTASFLAGGEIPIPVVQSVTTSAAPTVTIEYKDFGVGLSFTPTIIGGRQVNLVINSEVSAIDPALSVTISGFSVPGLKVRRAKTTVEMNDGQSFAIAGLLQDDFNNATNQLPLLGNIPVLGALFRSSNFQHQQTDLVIIITAHVVQPTVAKNLTTPVDNLVLPTPLEQFGNGTIEKSAPAPQTNDKQGYVLP
jgi:pilus assembly protein CpaC